MANLQDFRPSEFMRARRPELFSDSKVVAEARLSREVFEYHLDTLTRRKQENEFEYFCRRLAEKELCPNLLPQTGPTGGGDSKVDAETYPVADAISLQWYEGMAREAGEERWAFAFSAKKDWRSKVQSDVKNIVTTKRDYKLVYFITNQFVADKARADVEDRLRRKYRVDVRILDRTWIVERVFKSDLAQLAIDALHLTGYVASQRIAGPHDTKREAELQELEKQIENPNRYNGVQYQLVEDCLRAALLARGLEKPRFEVDGRFARAERVAEKVGHRQQRLRVIYAKAWTVFWWYDDFYELTRLYDQVEELAVGSAQATDLELLTNLWQILRTTVVRRRLDAEAAKLDPRTATLRAELERLAANQDRPNNALQARTNRLLMDLHLAMGNVEGLNQVLAECKDILTASEGLPSYPVKPLTDIIREIGDILTDNPVYDELFESVVNFLERRKSDSEAGTVLLQRGFQKLRAGKRYDAIRLLGRAQIKLAMRERRGELVAALGGCGAAYEAAGLLWAARANILAAANHALAEFWEHGEVVPRVLPCLQKLVWIELQLGRVPWVLAWMETASVIAGHLMLEGKRRKAFTKERENQDMVLGLLLLRTDLWELRWLDFMPQLLEDLGLPYSRMAILYALGHEDHLRVEGTIPESESHEAVRELFWQWVNQPGGDDLPERPELLLQSEVTLRSFVLGCEIIVKAANNLASIQLGETILAALEALLATSLGERVLPYRSELRFNVRPSDFTVAIPEYRIVGAEGAPVVEIRHSSGTPSLTVDERTAFRDWLLKVVAQTISQVAVIDDAESYFERLARDEAGFGRALNIADISICVKNILGNAPRVRVADWEKEAKSKRFVLRRSSRWDEGLKRKEIGEKGDEVTELRPGEGEPPPELFGVDQLRHRDRRVLSLIDIPLWDKAEWQGTVYGHSLDLSAPPLLALAFKDEAAARAIFQGLRSRLGKVDTDERLRVSIITGIDKTRPASYCVVIGANLKLEGKETVGTHWVTVSRINRMEPTDSRNLDTFLMRFSRIGKYILLPAHFAIGSGQPKLLSELGIEKRQIRVCPAWQLGQNDPDICALQADDDPIIPEGVENPPVVQALKQIAERRPRASR